MKNVNERCLRLRIKLLGRDRTFQLLDYGKNFAQIGLSISETLH